MGKRIDEIVARNRRSLRGTQSRFVSIQASEATGLFFGTSKIEATVSTELQKRAEGSSDPWVDAGATRQSGVVVNQGKELIAASLDGQGNTLGAIVFGDDGTEATRFDTTLGNETGSLAQDTATDDDNDVVVTSVSQLDETPFTGTFEVGLEDSAGTLLTREVYDGASLASGDEVRLIVTITLTGAASGQAVYTTIGLNSMAQAVVASSRIVFKAWEFSDTADGVDASDTSIANTVFRNQTSRSVVNRDVEVTSNVTTDDTPDASIPFDIVESGVIDEDQNLVWGSPNATFTVESDTEFVAKTTTRIV